MALPLSAQERLLAHQYQDLTTADMTGGYLTKEEADQFRKLGGDVGKWHHTQRDFVSRLWFEIFEHPRRVCAPEDPHRAKPTPNSRESLTVIEHLDRLLDHGGLSPRAEDFLRSLRRQVLSGRALTDRQVEALDSAWANTYGGRRDTHTRLGAPV